jgi:predicted kinase
MKIATEEMPVTCVVDKVRRVPAINEFMESPADSGGGLIIVCGLPGSGKTTYAKQLEAKLAAVRFCPDEWMDALSLDLWDEARRQKIESLQWEFAQQLLAHRETVIIEWGTWARPERDALRLRARELRAAVELHYISASVDVLLDRIERRRMENPPISREQLLDWADVFQAPAPDETALFDHALTVEIPAMGNGSKARTT